MIRRGLAVVLLALGLAVGGPVLLGVAQPAAAVGSVVTKACAPAPEPASPLAGLPGKLYGKPATATDADPFTSPGVDIADVYGYAYHWVNYDNGCIPGSDALPATQTAMGNLLLAGSAAVGAFTHGLYSLVVTPNFMSPLDGVLSSATAAVKGGFWDPWLTAILVLVAAGVLVTAMRADVSSAVTTVGWALLVLVGATYVMSYPVTSARAVDDLVQTTIATSARAVGAAERIQGPPVTGDGGASVSEAQAALDDMFDTINRDLYYTAWLDGTLGASDTAVAREYGPDLFRASHLTWSEAEVVRADPDAGRDIIEAKNELWVSTAAAVERADSAAYQQLTGNRGRWDAAGTVALRVALLLPFLAVAAVFVVVSYVATRVFVPLAPGFGVLGLLYVAQDWMIGVLKQVGRFVILGPLFFIGALANLLLATSVLDSDLAFGVKLVMCAGIPFLLFKLLRPRSAIPGARTARRMARGGLGALLTAVVTKRAANAGVQQAQKKQDDDGESASPRREPSPYRYAYPRNAPVAMGELKRGSERYALPEGRFAGRPLGLPESGTTAARGGYVERDNGASAPAAAGTRWNELPRRTRRELAAAGSPVARDVAAPDGGTSPSAGPGPTSARSASRENPTRAHPPIRPDEHDVDLSAPADKGIPRGEVIGHDTELPRSVVEATTTYDGEGRPVFEIWRPPTASRPTGEDGEEYR